MADDQLQQQDISTEQWREYVYAERTYRIDVPVAIWRRTGGTTHRVLDAAGIVHCPPLAGAVIRWQPKDPTQPVQF